MHRVDQIRANNSDAISLILQIGRLRLFQYSRIQTRLKNITIHSKKSQKFNGEIARAFRRFLLNLNQ